MAGALPQPVRAGGIATPVLETTRRLAVVAILLLALSRTAAAQETVIEAMRLDRLQLVTLGGGIGGIAPSQVEPATVFAIGADYGEISPAWRMIFRVSYWESRFKADVVSEFADTLQQNLENPGGATVRRSPISVYDATFALGARRLLSPRARMSAFFSGGMAAHVIDAEGDLIRGTFVERALDDIAAGIFGEAGVTARVLPRLRLEASARGDLLSGFRSTQWMVIGSYFFGEPRPAGSR